MIQLYIELTLVIAGIIIIPLNIVFLAFFLQFMKNTEKMRDLINREVDYSQSSVK